MTVAFSASSSPPPTYRYNALLQMFGEKAEEYDELRMDLEHVKTMYKQQIEELVQKDSFRR